MKKTFLIIAFVLFSNHFLSAQSNFKSELDKNNSVAENVTLSIQEKIKIHQAYLQKAISEKNDKHQFFGFLYLFDDYRNNADYTNANENLLKAEVLAKKSKNVSWQGIIYMCRGRINIAMKKPKIALKYYKLSLKNFSECKDSVAIAENFHHISTAYGELEDFDKSHYYFKLAMPLYKKYKKEKDIACRLSRARPPGNRIGRNRALQVEPGVGHVV